MSRISKQKSVKPKYIIILICICSVSLIVGFKFFLKPKDATKVEAPDMETAKASTTESSEKTTLPETTVIIELPEELKSALQKNGVTIDALEFTGCQQLIMVEDTENSVNIKFFEKKQKQWNQTEETLSDVHIGKNGLTANKVEGDGCTPVGFYKIGSAFYINQKPATKLDLFQITEKSYWVDDPNSSFYNQYVVGTDKKDWNSAEHMIDYNGYRYGFVVDYNSDCVPQKGSAIFFHVGYNPTAGCIAMNETSILKYLSLLDKEKNPFVLIV